MDKNWPSEPQHDPVVRAQLRRVTGQDVPPPDRHRLRPWRLTLVVLVAGVLSTLLVAGVIALGRWVAR